MQTRDYLCNQWLRSWGVLLLVGLHSLAGAATLQDYGFQHKNVDGQLSLGNRPLLLIVVNFAGANPFIHDVPWYDNYFFNLLRTNSLGKPQSVNGAFLEMSNGRFFWSRGGAVGPLSLPASQRFDNFNTSNARRDQLYASNIIYQAWASNLFKFADYDANGDGHVSNAELQIAILSNDADGGGAARWAGTVRGPGATVDWTGNVAELGHLGDFATHVHELSHTLGTIDLYGVWNQQCLSQKVTLMSCTIGGLESPEIYHLDPWHKMQLGWSEPRIRLLRTSGIETIPAAQMVDPQAPIILVDPVRGAGEFFILEYRSANSPNGSGYDANVADTGLAIWHIQQNSSHDPTAVPRVEAGPLPAQTMWRFCNKCKGLHFITDAGTPSYGPCPKGGSHVATNSPAVKEGVVLGYQVVMNNNSAPGQHGWRWCSKCQGMFYGPNQADSRCPAGGMHDGSSSGDYSFVQNDPNTPGQDYWRLCYKCQGLCYGLAIGNCPAGDYHDGAGSGEYAVLFEGGNSAVWNEGPPIVSPAFGRGSSTFWHEGEVSSLRWIDGSTSETRIVVHPFSAGDGSITVEWIEDWVRDEWVWVDFNYFGPPEFGTFDFPFNTLAEGVGTVPWGGTLKIKSGSSSERRTINQRMVIEAYGGPVTIGR